MCAGNCGGVCCKRQRKVRMTVTAGGGFRSETPIYDRLKDIQMGRYFARLFLAA